MAFSRPICKINLGLNVVERRPDGYHNLETVFYPVPIHDALEVFPMDEAFPSAVDCDLKVTNLHIDGDEQKNLVVRAYNLLKQDFPAMPRVHAHLYKGIPTQAGMGGAHFTVRHREPREGKRLIQADTAGSVVMPEPDHM